MIPFAATIGVDRGKRGSLRLWIPLFLVWLLLLPLVLVLFPLAFVVGLWARINAFRLYGVVWRILSSLRNTLVEVTNDGVAFRLRVL
jgi:hypothetical protein